MSNNRGPEGLSLAHPPSNDPSAPGRTRLAKSLELARARQSNGQVLPITPPDPDPETDPDPAVRDAEQKESEVAAFGWMVPLS